MESQAMKYVEVKEIVGGTTSAQGGPSSGEDSFDSILARNIEYWNFGADNVHTKVTELDSEYVEITLSLETKVVNYELGSYTLQKEWMNLVEQNLTSWSRKISSFQRL